MVVGAFVPCSGCNLHLDYGNAGFPIGENPPNTMIRVFQGAATNQKGSPCQDASFGHLLLPARNFPVGFFLPQLPKGASPPEISLHEEMTFVGEGFEEILAGCRERGEDIFALGVIDGHGADGHHVAQFMRQMFLNGLTRGEGPTLQGLVDRCQAMTEQISARTAQAHVERGTPEDAESSGSNTGRERLGTYNGAVFTLLFIAGGYAFVYFMGDCQVVWRTKDAYKIGPKSRLYSCRADQEHLVRHGGFVQGYRPSSESGDWHVANSCAVGDNAVTGLNRTLRLFCLDLSEISMILVATDGLYDKWGMPSGSIGPPNWGILDSLCRAHDTPDGSEGQRILDGLIQFATGPGCDDVTACMITFHPGLEAHPDVARQDAEASA